MTNEDFLKTKYLKEYINIELLDTNNTNKKCFKNASKELNDNQGNSDFMLKRIDNVLIFGEFKPSTDFHINFNEHNEIANDKNSIKKYAVNGVKFYQEKVLEECNDLITIAIALSIEEKDNIKIKDRIDIFLINKEKQSELLDNEKLKIYILDFIKQDEKYIQENINILKKEISQYFENIENAVINEQKINKLVENFHDKIWNHINLNEQEKPLIFALILLLITHNKDDTIKIFERHENVCGKLYINIEEIFKKYIKHIKMVDKKRGEIDKKDAIVDMDLEIILRNFYFIKNCHHLTIPNEKLKLEEKGMAQSPLSYMFLKINEIYELGLKIPGLDILSLIYNKFSDFKGSDGKGLGIVTTPKHITNLMNDLIEVNEEDIILDPCSGTGSFVIHSNAKKIYAFDVNNFMFTLLASNFIIHNKKNFTLFFGSIFDPFMMEYFKNEIKDEDKPTKGIMNPPYSQEINELEFTKQLLSYLKPNSKCSVIIPMSLSLNSQKQINKTKSNILEEHTLESCMSMPDQLFIGRAGVITIIMNFIAKRKHKPDNDVWFGYWKDDGFEVLRHKGRIDNKNKWKDIRKNLLLFYKRKEIKSGHSILQNNINSESEWCAEAYLETNYFNIKEEDFINEMKNYLAFKLKNEQLFIKENSNEN